MGPPLEYIQQTSFIVVPVLVAFVTLGPFARRLIGPPWAWDAVRNFLDRFQEYLFEQEGPKHHHRVTLFKRTRFRWSLCRWPWSGWLVPIARSGHATQKTSTAFLAPDKADLAEGVAGQAWVRDESVVVSDLPNIGGNNPSDKNLDRYAVRTWVSKRWLRRNKQHARFFCGIPVEVRGKPWGVIVLDSRNPNPEVVKDNRNALRFYRFAGSVLGKLIEGT